MEEPIAISNLNDFIFCPVSIYFHNLYGAVEKSVYQSTYQTNGSAAHKTIDTGTYSSRKSILQGISVYSEEFGVQGRIDIFDEDKKLLTERKRTVIRIYDGYIFQLYAQYYAMTEMGYDVRRLRIHSITDNKNYDIRLPSEDNEMDEKFRGLITQMRTFDMSGFVQNNAQKCRKCIYEPSCDRSLLC
ncbi:MAG: type V CRISPR-associated protein Cas4 [Synergistes sp.]|nr:type V CRISPR-associated protein Cas4 [Synergistes sp.]